MKVKVCLVGEHAVGKTSLIKRYVLNEYDDRYIVTLGAKVSKKELAISPKGGDPVQMDMTIWDIMGSKGFRELLREAYFHGAQGILAVADITRYDTLEDLDSWVESVFRTVGEIPVTFALNKADLKDQAAFGEDDSVPNQDAADLRVRRSKTGGFLSELKRPLHELAVVAVMCGLERHGSSQCSSSWCKTRLRS